MSDPSNRPFAEIIVGICSARSTRERRNAVRETWLAEPHEGIECIFFIGDGEDLPGEPDTLVLPCPDGYDELPEKVLAFFRHCLARYDFEWIFKCDDDTYLALDRLRGLVEEGAELVGDELLNRQGYPSGGAGYLLSRRMVELVTNQPSLPLVGAEDKIIGHAAVNLGARFHASGKLCSTTDKFPSWENEMITSHRCSPRRIRMIHATLRETPRIVAVKHSVWTDNLSLYPSGFFYRHASRCSGRWLEGDGDIISLDWFDWEGELLIPEQVFKDDVGIHQQYRCVPRASIPGDPSTPRVVPALPPPAKLDHGTPTQAKAVFITTSEYGLPHVDRFL